MSPPPGIRHGTRIEKVLEALVALDKPLITVEEARAVASCHVQTPAQVIGIMSHLREQAYLRRVVQVTNRARRRFGLPEILEL